MTGLEWTRQRQRSLGSGTGTGAGAGTETWNKKGLNKGGGWTRTGSRLPIAASWRGLAPMADVALPRFYRCRAGGLLEQV